MLKPSVIVIGRYQPPHLGHYAIFDMAKEYIAKNGEVFEYPIVVVIDGEKSGKDKSRNPLSPEERINIMRGSGHANDVKYMIAKDVMEAIEKLKAAGYDPVAVATGSDRGDSYVKLLNKYYETDNERESLVLTRSELDVKPGTVDDILANFDKDTPVEFISGSLVRATVQKDEFDKFVIMTGLANNEKLAKSTFDKMKSSMNGEDNV